LFFLLLFVFANKAGGDKVGIAAVTWNTGATDDPTMLKPAFEAIQAKQNDISIEIVVISLQEYKKAYEKIDFATLLDDVFKPAKYQRTYSNELDSFMHGATQLHVYSKLEAPVNDKQPENAYLQKDKKPKEHLNKFGRWNEAGNKGVIAFGTSSRNNEFQFSFSSGHLTTDTRISQTLDTFKANEDVLAHTGHAPSVSIMLADWNGRLLYDAATTDSSPLTGDPLKTASIAFIRKKLSAIKMDDTAWIQYQPIQDKDKPIKDEGGKQHDGVEKMWVAAAKRTDSAWSGKKDLYVEPKFLGNTPPSYRTVKKCPTKHLDKVILTALPDAPTLEQVKDAWKSGQPIYQVEDDKKKFIAQLPGWIDRVLIRLTGGVTVRHVYYDVVPKVKGSDHYPAVALFTISKSADAVPDSAPGAGNIRALNSPVSDGCLQIYSQL